MKTRTSLDELKDFLKQDSSGKVRLAVFLGYKTSVTIDQWISRDAIPQRELERVLQFMKEEKKK